MLKRTALRYRLIGLSIISTIGVVFVFSNLTRKIPPTTHHTPTTTKSSGTKSNHSASPARSSLTKSAQDFDKPSEQLLKLQDLLPQWLRDKGELFEDQREIHGQTIFRTRARYEWENGELLEIEITDIGLNADPKIIQSLGLNLEFSSSESESGYTLTQSAEHYLLNEEYDHNDQAGSLQLLIQDRFLLELHIEGLPQETFQKTLDQDIPFEKIFR